MVKPLTPTDAARIVSLNVIERVPAFLLKVNDNSVGATASAVYVDARVGPVATS